MTYRQPWLEHGLETPIEEALSVAYGVSEPDSPRSPRKSVLIGPDGKVCAAYDTVKPADHPGQVIADLDGLK